MDQIGNNETYEKAPTSDKAPRGQVGSVVNLLDMVENSFSCFFANVLVVPKNLGNGHYRNAEIPGNVLHRISHWFLHLPGSTEDRNPALLSPA